MIDESTRPAKILSHTPPIVGREAERILLQEQLRSITSGNGQLCIVSGEAGIGKTTHVQEMIAEANRRQMKVLIGHCFELMAAPPYGLWLDLSRNYESSMDATNDVPLPKAFITGSRNHASNQVEVFDQMKAFLVELSSRQPTVLVLEDVHWADPVSLELIRFISSRLSCLRVCVVITYRVDELTRQNPLYRQLPAIIRESGGLRIDLEPLRRDDIVSLVQMQYPMSAEDQARLTDFLVIHSQGNPFFAVELLRALESRGSEGGLWRSGDSWHLATLEQLVVPPLVRQFIDLRLERLGPNVRAPLALAAVIGQDIPLELWQSLVEIDESALLEIIDIAVDSNILVASPDGTLIHFVHALTREVLYSSILPPRRRVLHREVADALLKLPRLCADSVAFHMHQSGDARTSEWMIRAGELAQRAYAWLTARDHFHVAAEALAGVPGQELLRAQLLYRCGRLLRFANARRGIDDISLVPRLAELAGNAVLAAEAEYSLGLLQMYTDKWKLGLETMESGINRIEALPAEKTRTGYSRVDWFADALPTIDLPSQVGIDPAAVCLTKLGINHRRGGLPMYLAFAGHLDRAISEAESFLTHVDKCGRGPLVLSAAGHSLFGLGIAHAARGEPGLARAYLAAARARYAPLDHHAVIAFTFLSELQDVMLRYATDDLAGRQTVADEARAALERTGGALPVDFSMRRAELPLMWIDGRWDAARNVAEESGTLANSILRRPLSSTIARIDYHQGHSGSVWAQIAEILPDGPAAEPGSAVLADALLLQSLAFNLALDTGDLELAQRWLNANEKWLQWSGSVAGLSGHYLDQAHLDMVTGKWESAATNAGRAVEHAIHPRQPLAQIAALRMRGIVSTGSGKRANAESDFLAAISLADACNAPFERALTVMEMHRAGIDPDEEALKNARAVGERLRATKLLDWWDGVTAANRVESSLEAELTARENDVLKLAAEGLTDIEIGQRLSISHRTVGQHLRSVYAKLDVHTRAAATRFAIEHELV